MQEAIIRYGLPEIFNTDQGCEFTSQEFTGLLQAHGIQISEDTMNAEYESWVETLDTLADPEEMEAIREGEAYIRAGNVVSFQEAFGRPPREA